MYLKSVKNAFLILCLGCISFLLVSCQPNPVKQEALSNQPIGFELTGITIDELQAKLQSGELTSRQVTQMYMDRITEIDKNGPALHAVIEINPDALAIADSLDHERKNHKKGSSLYGIPVLIKDNIDTGDKMQTTAGSDALDGNKATKDAFIIQKLRESGAIILGKTNLSEWANFRSANSISGWSSRGGQTKNPYVLDHTPCGSSTGSAVAVAADLCVVSIGTATDGSISCPASMNGVVGMRLSVGLLSCSGLIPISKTLDTPGPIGRNVRDVVILLGAMTGIDKVNPAGNEKQEKGRKDYTLFLDPNGLEGKRIGVEKSMLHHEDDPICKLLEQALEQMKDKGATIVEVEFQSQYYEKYPSELEVMKYEFKDGINRYLASANGKVKSLNDIIQFNKQNASTMMQYFGQDLMESAQSKGDLNSPEYKKALNTLLSMGKYISDLMDSKKLDALCGVGNGASGAAAMSQCPSITIPMGLVDDLPVGITFFGRPFDEPAIIPIAYGYEQASHHMVAPKFIKTINQHL